MQKPFKEYIAAKVAGFMLMALAATPFISIFLGYGVEVFAAYGIVASMYIFAISIAIINGDNE